MLRQHESELSHHLFNMNIDLAGQSLGGTVIGITGDSSICRQFEALAEKCGIGMRQDHLSGAVILTHLHGNEFLL